jgi:hypothetical protein
MTTRSRHDGVLQASVVVIAQPRTHIHTLSLSRKSSGLGGSRIEWPATLGVIYYYTREKARVPWESAEERGKGGKDGRGGRV